VLTDLDSKNGTLLNGSPVQTAHLSNGDTITIGKYQIVFQLPAIEESAAEDLDQTVIIPHFRSDAPPPSPAPKACERTDPPRLFRKSVQEEYVLNGERTVIGSDRGADIRMGGLFGPRVAAEVVRRGGDFVLQAKDPRRKVRINGEELEEKVLQEEDLIAIGSEEFVFKT
jgi:pSer/pThr/pTyr-binding forkhead associated (FHA) protein